MICTRDCQSNNSVRVFSSGCVLTSRRPPGAGSGSKMTANKLAEEGPDLPLSRHDSSFSLSHSRWLPSIRSPGSVALPRHFPLSLIYKKLSLQSLFAQGPETRKSTSDRSALFTFPSKGKQTELSISQSIIIRMESVWHHFGAFAPPAPHHILSNGEFSMQFEAPLHAMAPSRCCCWLLRALPLDGCVRS